jgi:hypothetical protein
MVQVNTVQVKPIHCLQRRNKLKHFFVTSPMFGIKSKQQRANYFFTLFDQQASATSTVLWFLHPVFLSFFMQISFMPTSVFQERHVCFTG